jgi:hypothetical protein
VPRIDNARAADAKIINVGLSGSNLVKRLLNTSARNTNILTSKNVLVARCVETERDEKLTEKSPNYTKVGPVRMVETRK